MKIKTTLNLFAIALIVFLQTNFLTAQEFSNYDEIVVDDNFETERSGVLFQTVNFTFATNTIEYNSTPLVVDVDFDNGAGFVPLNSLTATKTYATFGPKTIKVKLQAGINTVYRKDIELVIAEPNHDYYSPDDILDIEVPNDMTWTPPANCTPYPAGSNLLNGDIGTAKAYVKYAEGHTAIIKPIIFVDGLDLKSDDVVVLDPSVGKEPEDQIIRYGSIGWDILVMGSSESFTSPHPNYENSEFALYPTAFQAMRDEGYDIIFLDFERGADYIQKNARLLIQAIQEINAEKQIDPLTGVLHENVVAGASMGGQIARYALATMEAEQLANGGACHQTSTYISFDSPHKGANIAMGLQAAAWYLDKTGNDENRLWVDLNLPAPRQLLVEHFGDAMQDGKLFSQSWTGSTAYSIETNFSYGCLRENYVAEMEELGYPTSTRNIAISCGSQTGIDQGYNEDAQLYFGEYRVNTENYGAVFRSVIWALNGGHANDWSVKTGHWLCGGQSEYSINADRLLFLFAKPDEFDFCYLANKDLPESYESVAIGTSVDFNHYDNAPGCYRLDLFDFEDAIEKELAKNNGGQIISEVNSGRYQQTFMPTMSTLDIDWEMNNANMWKDISTSNIIANELTPFSAYYAPAYNLRHIELDEPMIDWMLAQLKLSETDLQPDLPTNTNPQKFVYNFGEEGKNRIPEVTIAEGGVLRVNKGGETGYLPNGVTGTDQPHFTAYTGGCDANITIEAGGQFILGDEYGNVNNFHNANVHITEQNTLHVKAGGLLRVSLGSQLIVEEGASLIIDEGAVVELLWEQSSIHVKGELIVNGNFAFEGAGFFQFDNTHTLTLNADFNLIGQHDRFLRLNEGTTLDIGSRNLNLKWGTVEYRNDSKITTGSGSNVNFNGMIFTNDNEQGAIVAAIALHATDPGKVYCVSTRFENLLKGIRVDEFQVGNAFTINTCEFANVNIGVDADGGDQINIHGSTFTAFGNAGYGISAFNVEDVNITACTIEDFFSGLALTNVLDAYIGGVTMNNNTTGATLKDVPNYLMIGGSINQTDPFADPSGKIGILAPYDSGGNLTNITLRGNATISLQDYGINVMKGEIIDQTTYGKVYMNCSKLVNNVRGIIGQDITLDIDVMNHCGCDEISEANPNSFIKYPGPQNNPKHFEICYLSIPAPETISAQGNFWSGGSQAVSDYLIRTNPEEGDCNNGSNVPLINDIKATSEPEGCSPGGGGVSPPHTVRRDNSEANTSEQSLSDSKEAILVYPNPTSGTFTLELTEGDYSIRILDVLGKTIFKQESVSASTNLQSNNWPKGIYLIQAIEKTTKVQLQTKLLVQ